MLESDPLAFLPYLSLKKLLNIFLAHSSFLLSRIFRHVIVWGKPYTLNMEVTNFCNLKCRECPTGMGLLKRPQGNMSLADFTNYIDQTKEFLVYVTLYFQGEPFLNKDLLAMVAYAHRNGIYTMISTNGHFFGNDEICRQIMDSGLGTLIISLDGISEETYDQYRIGGQVKNVMAGITRLARVRRDLHQKSPRLYIQFLVLKYNEHEMDQVTTFAKEAGVDRVIFKSAQVYNFDDMENILPADPKYRRYEKDRSGRWQLKGKTMNSCRKLWANSLITWDGQVVPCCFDKDARHQLGNLTQDSFASIWRNKEYTSFRRQILLNRAHIPICTNCAEGIKVYH